MIRPTGFALEARSKEPLYRQLFDQIVNRITSGTFPAGYRLPPTRELAGQLSTHRNTIVRAYEDLEAAGFVHSTVGKGTFVALLPRDFPADNPTRIPAKVRQGIPWTSLMSNGARVEALSRSERLSQRSPPSGAINMARMEPSEELLPAELFRRCIDHVLRTESSRALGYSPRGGVPRLREAVAEQLRSAGVPASPEDLIITTGSQQALDLVARTLVNPGDAFLVDQSTYAGAINLLSAAGARLIGVGADDEGPLVSELERHSRIGAKGFYLMPNCQNPTGSRITLARREALVEWSHASGVPLIEDDYASELNLDDKPVPPALRTLDGEVIYAGTFSKKLIPALRIGYLLAPRSLRNNLSALKHAMDLGTSELLQYALAEFLERGYLRAHLRVTVPEYRRRRDALEDALAKHLPRGTQWSHPETGVILWLRTPPPMSAEALFEEAERQGVLISPGTLNGVGSSDQPGVRLLFCAEPQQRLVEGARRLGRAWTAVERRQRQPRDSSTEATLTAV